MITLYHFCNSMRVPSIHEEGLTLGSIPVLGRNGKLAVNRGYQWLTTSGSWEQPWATSEWIKEDRTQVRLTIIVPDSMIENLVRWVDVQTMFGWVGNAGRMFNFGDEGENWVLWTSILPSHLITKTEERPKDEQPRKCDTEPSCTAGTGGIQQSPDGKAQC